MIGHVYRVRCPPHPAISIHPESRKSSTSFPPLSISSISQTNKQAKKPPSNYITVAMAICNEANEHSQHVEPETVEDSETEQEQEQEPESQHNLEVQSAPKPRPRMNDEQKRALQIHNQGTTTSPLKRTLSFFPPFEYNSRFRTFLYFLSSLFRR